VREVFDEFTKYSSRLRYSFDILEKNAGFELLSIAQKNSILNNIEITDRRLPVLGFLRKNYKSANLIYTMAEHIKELSKKTVNIKKLRKLDIGIINVRCKRKVEHMFKEIIDSGFRCYIWGVNTKANMKKVINMKYRGENVSAIYTDYPDRINNLLEDHFN
jgi:hypothetical protein